MQYLKTIQKRHVMRLTQLLRTHKFIYLVLNNRWLKRVLYVHFNDRFIDIRFNRRCVATERRLSFQTRLFRANDFVRIGESRFRSSSFDNGTFDIVNKYNRTIIIDRIFIQLFRPRWFLILSRFESISLTEIKIWGHPVRTQVKMGVGVGWG